MTDPKKLLTDSQIGNLLGETSPPAKVRTILQKLHDLLEQATTEKSHYYVASVCRDAINEITRLQLLVDKNSEYAWRYEDLRK